VHWRTWNNHNQALDFMRYGAYNSINCRILPYRMHCCINLSVSSWTFFLYESTFNYKIRSRTIDLGCLIARVIVTIEESLEFPTTPGNLAQVSMRSMVVSRGREFIVPLGMCITSNGTTIAFESLGIPCRRRVSLRPQSWRAVAIRNCPIM